MATRGWYMCVLSILAKLELLSVPIEHYMGFGQPVIVNEYLGFLMSFELGLMVVFELWVSDKLFVAVAVNILLAAVVDKLEIDIWVVNILAVASLTGKLVDMVLDWIGNSELGTGNQSFDIDFPIVGCYYKISSWL
ncbi:hypothetical protein G9A89_010850 [Geosiphon pyriformis]|nr:hypothetical protein G9A89_010850 [Geosiphon pyriformis]